MDTYERIAIESDCTKLINQFMWCADTLAYEEGIALFVPDCTFSRVDEVYEGHEGVRTVLEGRPKNRRSCHLLSGIVIDVVDSDTAKGKAHALVYDYVGPLEDHEAAPLGEAYAIVKYDAAFRRTEAGWRFSRWHIGLNFHKPSA